MWDAGDVWWVMYDLGCDRMIDVEVDVRARKDREMQEFIYHKGR